MTKILNGSFRRTTLTVTKTLDSVLVDDYPKEYSILDGFGSFVGLTDAEFSELSDEDYGTRLAAFMVYVEANETGLDTTDYDYESGEEPYGDDAVLCPIGQVVE